MPLANKLARGMRGASVAAKRETQAQQYAEMLARQKQMEEATATPEGAQPTPSQQQQARPRNPRNYPWDLDDGIHFDLKGVPFKVKGGRIVRMTPEEADQAEEIQRLRQERAARLDAERRDRNVVQEEMTRARGSREFRYLQSRNLEMLNIMRRKIANGVDPQVAREEAITEVEVAAKDGRFGKRPRLDRRGKPGSGDVAIRNRDKRLGDTQPTEGPVQGAEEVPVERAAPEDTPVEAVQPEPVDQTDQFLNAITTSIPSVDEIKQMDMNDLGVRVQQIQEDVTQFVQEGRMNEQQGQRILDNFVERITESGREREFMEAFMGADDSLDAFDATEIRAIESRADFFRTLSDPQTTLEDAVDAAVDMSDNPMYGVLGSKLKKRLQFMREELGANFNFEVATPRNTRVPEDVRQEFANRAALRGRAQRTQGGVDVFINANRASLTPVTVMHEAVHAATEAALSFGRRVPDSELGRVSRQLEDTLEQVRKTLDIRRMKFEDGVDLDQISDFEARLFQGSGNAVANADELLAWGLTDSRMQDLLRTIKVEGREDTAWDLFVEAIRKVLGLNKNERTALDEVLQAGSDILGNTEDVSAVLNSRTRRSSLSRLDDGVYQDEAGALFEVRGGVMSRVE